VSAAQNCSGVSTEGGRAGKIGGIERAERVDQRRRGDHGDTGCGAGDDQRFEAGLPAQPGVVGAERKAHRELASPALAVGQQHVDQVDERDDEHGADGAGDQQQHRPRRLGDLVLEAGQADADAAGVALGILRHQALRDRAQLRLRLIEGRGPG
jgi:hypothetical protein